MKLLKIGTDYYNADALLKIEASREDSAVLRFKDNISVSVVKNDLDGILKFIGGELYGVAQGEKRSTKPY
jgi:hypothetical protein